MMRLLTPRRLQENEDEVLRLADRQLDKVIPTGTFELLRSFAQPYALLVIAALLGVPEEDHPTFAAQFGLERTDPAIGGDQQVSLDPLAFLAATFTDYVEDRRREPRDDVLTRLATATYPDGSTPEVADVVRTATFLFAAGQDTTARLITAAVAFIGDDPELQRELRDHRERIPDFVEEVLRLEGPIKLVSRIARITTTLAGVEIPAGATVAVFPHAGNRDPRHFDDPHELRLDRPNSRDHLSFGRGIHACPGGPLARVETRIALERIFDRTTDLRVSASVHGPAGSRHFDHDPTYLFRGVRKLVVDVTPS
jgi:cytochrome P450